MTCSCSGAVTQNGLLADVVVAAGERRSFITSLGAREAPASISSSTRGTRGNYLTVLAYRVG